MFRYEIDLEPRREDRGEVDEVEELDDESHARLPAFKVKGLGCRVSGFRVEG